MEERSEAGVGRNGIDTSFWKSSEVVPDKRAHRTNLRLPYARPQRLRTGPLLFPEIGVEALNRSVWEFPLGGVKVLNSFHGVVAFRILQY